MTLQQFNTAGESVARDSLLECCASTRWAEAMVQRRPFVNCEALLTTAEQVWWELETLDWLEAFAAHPKIGERKLSEWCSQEQSGVLSEPAEVLQGLAEANDAYELKFGWIFLINASGKSGSQILDQLRSRILNTKDNELRIAAGEQAQITALRLTRWMAQ